MQVLQIVLVVAVCLLTSQYGNCLDFAASFNKVAAFASQNGGYDNPEARRMLTELKTDMIRACREGTLKQATQGYFGISWVGGTATKAYSYTVKGSTEKENHVLPDVDCRLGESKSETYYDDLNKARVVPSALPEQRSFPAFRPIFQNQRTEQTLPSWWLQLASRFESIRLEAAENEGYLTHEGSLALQDLKLDIMSACKAGEMRVVGPGKDIKGLLNTVTIPTKVYVLTTLPTYEEKTLPDVDCSVTSPFVPNVDNGKSMSLQERLNPIPSSPYSYSSPLATFPRSTSLSEEDMRRKGLFMQDDQESSRGYNGYKY